MKTRFIYFILMALLFSACSQDEVDYNASDQSVKEQKQLRFYGVKRLDKGTKGVAQERKLWPVGSTINIQFMNGYQEMHNEVIKYASEWSLYANINFKFSEYYSEEPSDVRISFEMDDVRSVTWSYTGTDAKQVTDMNQPTMNFANWSLLTEEERKGDVLRAFGQMLGLELEHRHLSLDVQWSTKIEGFWYNQIGDIPWAELKEYVATPLSNDEGYRNTGMFDANSIMIWPFTRGMVVYSQEPIPTEFNISLSEMDKEFIGSLYPHSDDFALAVLVNAEYGNTYFKLGVRDNTDIRVDWGDGNVVAYNSANTEIWGNAYVDEYGQPAFEAGDAVFGVGLVESTKVGTFNYEYTDPSYSSFRVVKVYGNKELISDFFTADLINFNMHNVPYLTLFGFEYGESLNSAKKLDLSDMPQLRVLYVYNTRIEDLIIDENSSLADITISMSNLKSIDLSHLPELSYLNVSENQLTSLSLPGGSLTRLNCSSNYLKLLDITGQYFLQELYCSYNSLIDLNLSSNEGLEILECDNNQIGRLDVAACYNINRITLYNNPIVTNSTELTRLANSMPVITNDWGANTYNNLLFLNNYTSAQWVKNILTPKKWSVR